MDLKQGKAKIFSNPNLICGLGKHSRSKMYHRRDEDVFGYHKSRGGEEISYGGKNEEIWIVGSVLDVGLT